MPADIDSNFEIEGHPKTLVVDEVVNDEDEKSAPPLWKQAAGGVAGAVIALALYSAYEAAVPAVQAWVGGSEETQEEQGEGVSTTQRAKRREVQD